MSSVLETLYIQVKLETEEVRKGLATTQQNIKQLETEFKNLSHSSDQVNLSFKNVLQTTLGLFTSFSSFRTVLSGAAGAIEAIREVGQASRELNIDVTALDAWGQAVQRTGGSASQFQSSLSSLASHFGTTADIALKTLPRLADLFSRLNPRQALLYGKSLGLDVPTILLLQQGRREVEALVQQQTRLGLVTKEQVEITRKFDNALYDAQRAYSNFYRELTLPVLPGITKTIEYLISHQDVVKDAFKAMSLGVGILTAALIYLSGPLTKVAALLTTISAAYGVLKEDIEFFKKGKDSVFGRILGIDTKSPKTTNRIFQNVTGFQSGNALTSIPGQLFKSVKNAFGFGNPSQSTVNIGTVSINTAATDADGIALAARNSLQNHLSQLTSQVDNGVYK